jgi:transcriptional regulator with XRE-family HTH domain
MDPEFPNRIHALRNAHRPALSLRDLAQRTGGRITHTKLQRIETGATPPDFNDLKIIANALGIRVSGLLNDEDVEVRVDEFGAELLDLLATIPNDQRADVLLAAQHVARAVTGMAASRSAAALRGEPALVDKLAQRWNTLQDSDRSYALDLWNIAKLGSGA